MGPTCAGKTELAVRLVEQFPCDIVSVDSAMIYRGMDIGTAKPDAAILARAPHRLINIRDPVERYSAAQFREDALKELRAITASDRVPLLVGGTGLYFRALDRGLARLPSESPDLRRRLAADIETHGLHLMHERLKQLDPASAARIHPNDRQRILRALEVCELSGRPMSALLSQTPEGGALPYRIYKLVIAPGERKDLHARIEERFHGMLNRGFLKEVKSLFGRPDLHSQLPAMRVVGYRQAWSFLAGGCDYDAMVAAAISATRQLAKRQITWLRSESRALWFDANRADLADTVAAHIESCQLFER